MANLFEDIPQPPDEDFGLVAKDDFFRDGPWLAASEADAHCGVIMIGGTSAAVKGRQDGYATS